MKNKKEKKIHLSLPLFMEETKNFLQKLQLTSGLARNSLQAYKEDLQQFSLHLEHKKEQELSDEKLSQIVQDYLDALSYEQFLSPRSVARKISSLKKFFQYLYEKKIIAENLLKKFSAPRMQQ